MEPQPSATQQNAESGVPADFTISNTNQFESSDWTYVVGEIQNNLDLIISYVDISIILYDANNKILGTESVSPMMTPLYPDDVSPFVVSSDSWGNFDHYEFVINDWYEDYDPETLDLQFLTHSAYSDDYYLNIVGEVINNSDQPAEWVNIVGSIYDENGKLLNASITYTMVDTLAPGQRSPFKLYFGDNWDDTSDYFLQLNGSSAEPAEKVFSLVEYVYSLEDNSCTFSGTVRNISSQESGFASIIVSMYDENDQLINADWTFSDGDTIPANGTDTFNLWIYDCIPFDHETVIVE